MLSTLSLRTVALPFLPPRKGVMPVVLFCFLLFVFLHNHILDTNLAHRLIFFVVSILEVSHPLSLFGLHFDSLHLSSSFTLCFLVHIAACSWYQFSLVASARVFACLLEAQVPTCCIGAGTHAFA